MNIYYTIVRKIRFPKLSSIFKIKTATSKTMHNETKGEKTETFRWTLKFSFPNKKQCSVRKLMHLMFLINK